MRGITKSFGSVKALERVDLDVFAGKVTALVGDNGAGKSTLIKAISGISEPDGGTITWKGNQVHVRTPKEATDLGIATVYQDLALCDNLDIVQNAFLGRELRRHFLLDEGAMERKAKQALADLKVVTVRSIRQLVGSLSGGQRQAVAVAKAVMQNAQLVIMDEPTAALGVTQTALVIELIKHLAEQGVAVMVVSHNLNDVFAMADEIAVLYLGRTTGSQPVSELNLQTVLELITTGGVASQTNGSDAGPVTPAEAKD
ncbi:MAG TPA: ATP-binding cassette domain-containing protein [Acidimicrobiales bacterium]|nr:ATP-binding cassette domain-containing protein [Acidimicrobiales bacterium]